MTGFRTARVIQKLRLIISIQIYKVIKPTRNPKNNTPKQKLPTDGSRRKWKENEQHQGF